MKISTLLRGAFASLLLLAVLLSTFVTSAQPSHIPFSNNRETFSQMWNVSNTNWYFGTIPITAGSLLPVPASPYGSQKDTGAAGGNLALTTSVISGGFTHTDTVIATPLPGYGSLVVTAGAFRAGATTPTVTATLKSSSDGFTFDAVVGATVFTFAPTSLTAFADATVGKWSIVAPLDKYYQVFFTGDGSNAYMGQAWCDFQRIFHLNSNQ